MDNTEIRKSTLSAMQGEGVVDSTGRWDAMRAFAKPVTAVANEPVQARRRMRA